MANYYIPTAANIPAKAVDLSDVTSALQARQANEMAAAKMQANALKARQDKFAKHYDTLNNLGGDFTPSLSETFKARQEEARKEIDKAFSEGKDAEAGKIVADIIKTKNDYERLTKAATTFAKDLKEGDVAFERGEEDVLALEGIYEKLLEGKVLEAEEIKQLEESAGAITKGAYTPQDKIIADTFKDASDALIANKASKLGQTYTIGDATYQELAKTVTPQEVAAQVAVMLPQNSHVTKTIRARMKANGFETFTKEDVQEYYEMVARGVKRTDTKAVKDDLRSGGGRGQVEFDVELKSIGDASYKEGIAEDTPFLTFGDRKVSGKNVVGIIKVGGKKKAVVLDEDGKQVIDDDATLVQGYINEMKLSADAFEKLAIDKGVKKLEAVPNTKRDLTKLRTSLITKLKEVDESSWANITNEEVAKILKDSKVEVPEKDMIKLSEVIRTVATSDEDITKAVDELLKTYARQTATTPQAEAPKESGQVDYSKYKRK